MTAVKVLLILLLVLLALSLLRVGGDVEYDRDGVRVRLRIGAIRVQVFPLKKKENTAKDTPETKKPTNEPPKKGGRLALVKELLPLICQAAGELKRQICIDVLRLDFVAGGSDPVRTAMLFGYSNAVAGMVLPLFEQNFNVKERRVRTAMDFNAGEPTIYIYVAFSARAGQLVSFVLRFGWKFLNIYQKNKGNPEKEAN